MAQLRKRRYAGRFRRQRAAFDLGIRHGHRRQRAPGSGSFQLGEPPGRARLLSPPGGLVPGRAIGHYRGDSADPARLELAKILRRSENAFVGVARACSTSSPASSAGPTTRCSSIVRRSSTTVCRLVNPARRSSSATRRPRAAWPTGCTIAGAECETVVAYFRGSAGRCRQSLRDVSLEELRNTGTSSIRSAASGPGTCSPRTSGFARGLRPYEPATWWNSADSCRPRTPPAATTSRTAPRPSTHWSRPPRQPRVPGRQALRRRLGRLHGQPGACRSGRGLRGERSHRFTPASLGSLRKSTSATPPKGPSAGKSHKMQESSGIDSSLAGCMVTFDSYSVLCMEAARHGLG